MKLNFLPTLTPFISKTVQDSENLLTYNKSLSLRDIKKPSNCIENKISHLLQNYIFNHLTPFIQKLVNVTKNDWSNFSYGIM